jgi:hypothetical protein
MKIVFWRLSRTPWSRLRASFAAPMGEHAASVRGSRAQSDYAKAMEVLAIAQRALDSDWNECLHRSAEPVCRCRTDVRAQRSGLVQAGRCRDDGCGAKL